MRCRRCCDEVSLLNPINSNANSLWPTGKELLNNDQNGNYSKSISKFCVFRCSDLTYFCLNVNYGWANFARESRDGVRRGWDLDWLSVTWLGKKFDPILSGKFYWADSYYCTGFSVTQIRASLIHRPEGLAGSQGCQEGAHTESQRERGIYVCRLSPMS